MRSYAKFLLPAAALLVVLLALAGCQTIQLPAGGKVEKRTLITTGYCRCGKCCGWKRTWFGKPVYSSGPNKGQRKEVGVTASGTSAKYGTIAADGRLFPFGTVMYVPGYGYGRVEDRGAAIKGDRIDLFFTSHGKAMKWGKQAKTVGIWYPPSAKK